MSKDILVVYNTCGISGRENSASYIKNIKSILSQEFDSFDLVVSCCMVNILTKTMLLNEFEGDVKFNFINEVHPVNVTFNHSVIETIKRYGEYNAYMYIDSVQ